MISSLTKILALGLLTLPSLLQAQEPCAHSVELPKDYWVFHFRSNDPLEGAQNPEERLQKSKEFLGRSYARAQVFRKNLGASIHTTANNRVGDGLYVAGDPAISKSYGPVLVAMKLQQGARIMDARGCGFIAPQDSTHYELLKSDTAAVLYDFSEAAESYFLTRSALVIRDEGVVDPTSLQVFDFRASMPVLSQIPTPEEPVQSVFTDLIPFTAQYFVYFDLLMDPMLSRKLENANEGLVDKEQARQILRAKAMVLEAGINEWAADEKGSLSTLVIPTRTLEVLTEFLSEARTLCAELLDCQRVLQALATRADAVAGPAHEIDLLLHKMNWLPTHQSLSSIERDQKSPAILSHWWKQNGESALGFLQRATRLKLLAAENEEIIDFLD